MLFSKSSKVFGSIALSVMMTNIPAVALAEPGMISTQEVLAEMNRAQAVEKVNEFLSRTDVQKLLMERGLSAEEASLRIASLSQTELKQLTGQIDQARAGGDILLAVLLVILIIFFAKRI